MTIPFWCLFVASFLPFFWFSFAGPAKKAQYGEAFDTHTPRLQDSGLKGRASRAHGAHVNAFEALAYFTPAVLVAHLAHADATWSARLAIAFIVCRVLHGTMYIADRPPLRTIFFSLGVVCSMALFVFAARA